MQMIHNPKHSLRCMIGDEKLMVRSHVDVGVGNFDVKRYSIVGLVRLVIFYRIDWLIPSARNGI